MIEWVGSFEINLMQEDLSTEIKNEAAKPRDAVAANSAELIAYRVSDWPPMRLVPAARGRQWMDATRDRHANRCLPLLMANQSGWWVLNSHPIEVFWTGGWDPSCMRVRSLDNADRCPANGHFGEGVLTFTLPYLFRTPAGYNLQVRGPANLPKDGIQALEGIVETDWSYATFTMNWKVTRPRTPIIFEKDEPICMIVPQKRRALEAFEPTVRDANSEPQFAQSFYRWWHSRTEFIEALSRPGSEELKEGWQKHYFQGVHLDGASAEEHQSKLELQSFPDMTKLPLPPTPFPEVRAHPEAIESLKRLGAGNSTRYETRAELRSVMTLYMQPGASLDLGKLVGLLVFRALDPDEQKADKQLTDRWALGLSQPENKLAIDAAIGTFALLYEKKTGDPEIAEARKKLWNEKLGEPEVAT
jgi:hypothetical protein